MKKTVTAILILACLLALSACGSGIETGNMLDTNIARIYSRAERQSVFVRNGELIEGSVRGKAVFDIAADGKTALAWVDNIVYFVSEKGVDLLASGTDSAEISFDGRLAFFLLDGKLCRYSADTRLTETVLEGVRSIEQIAISPRGESAVFTLEREGGQENESLLLRGGELKPVLEDTKCIVLAVSDGADTLYYLEPSGGRFCVRNGEETFVISENCGAASNFNFSNDLGEVNYTVNDGKSRLFRLSDKLDVVLCEGFGFTMKTDIYSMGAFTIPVYINDVSSFTNGLFLKRTKTEAGYVYDVFSINGKGETKPLIDGAEEYKLAAGTKRVIWIENGKLSSTTFSGKTKQLASDAVSFEVSKDGNTVYWVSAANTLFMIKGNGKPLKLDSGVDSIAAVGSGCAYIKDAAAGENGAGTLFFYENGSSKQVLTSAVRFDRRKGQLMVLTDPAADGSKTLFSVYVTVNGRDYTLFGENVEP
ncbi:MAG: hypothetical protein K6G56_01925 [Clostridiales bacterium]|nr:hypothetical protein [Clostridiales bacterium]